MNVLLFNSPLCAEIYFIEAEECCFGMVGRPVVPFTLLRYATFLKQKGYSVTFRDYAIERLPWEQALRELAKYDMAVTSLVHGALAHEQYKAFYEPLKGQQNLIALCFPDAATDEYYECLQLERRRLDRFMRLVPDFGELEVPIDYDLYPYHSTPNKVYVVQVATGCRYNCNFCVWAGKPYQLRAPSAVIEQLREITQRKTPRDLIFVLSSQITSDRTWLREFVGLKENLLPTLAFQGDIGIGEVDDEIAGLLKRSGIENATVGAEALSDGWLRKFRKAWTYASIKRGLLALQKAGVTYHLILRCGIGETVSDITESMKNLTELNSLGIKPGYVRWGKIYPYLGTAIANMQGKQEFRPELKLLVASLRTVGWIR
jgi:radical SAM superfamily enzyme YgiQ (UPF0313 family)